MKKIVKGRLVHLFNSLKNEESETFVLLKHKGRRSFYNRENNLVISYYQLLTDENTPLYECVMHNKNNAPLHIFSMYGKEGVGVVIDVYGETIIISDVNGNIINTFDKITDRIINKYLLEHKSWKKRSLKK